MLGCIESVSVGLKVVVVDVENELEGNFLFLLVVIRLYRDNEHVQIAFFLFSWCECQLFCQTPKKSVRLVTVFCEFLNIENYKV